MHYNDIIIGAGASGAVLAARLSEEPSRSVLLLEAGPYYATAALMPDDLLNGHNNSYTAHDWHYQSQNTVTGRSAPFPRGRVVGGSSAVNTSIALRGLPEDYDEWATLGNDAWSWERVLPYFRRLETDLDFDDDYHGTNGPIPIRRYREDELTPVQSAFMSAVRGLGWPEARDNNDPDSTGLAPHPMNKQGGLRMSVAICYLEPVRHRLNLTVRGDCHVRRVLTDGVRTSGVEVESGGVVQVVEGDRVILCGGAIATPAILMRSGLGPEGHLREHAIDVIGDLPGVGANLQDHPMLGVVFNAREGVLRDDDPVVQTTYRYTSKVTGERNDMQLMPVSQFRTPDRLTFVISSVIERQRSVGRVSLQSADPHAPPVIENRFMEDDEDVRRMIEGVRMAVEVGSQPAFDPIRDGEHAPGDGLIGDDEALASWCKHVAGSGFHPSCTAKMAPADDPMGVVGQDLRVRGHENLFVADASVMPVLMRANTHLTCIMIGERAAELVR